MNLKGKVVIVTGGAIGIGAATVSAMAEKGAKIVINYNRSAKEAERLTQSIVAYGGKAISIKADVSNEQEIIKIFDETVKKFGTVDVLVNNAGYSIGEDFLKGSRKLWLDQYENNFLSSVATSRQFLKINKGQLGKKIINVSSIYGFGGVGDTGYLQYSASKGALNNFTQSFAKLAAPILVNAVAPGYVWTPQWEGTSEKSKKEFAKELLINRFIEPGEVSDTIVFLAESDAITGTIITVDGGQTLKF